MRRRRVPLTPVATVHDDPLFELFLLNSGVPQQAIDQARADLRTQGDGGHLGPALVARGHLTAKKLEILLNLHARDLEDAGARGDHPIRNALLGEIMQMKALAARGDVAACERALALFEGLEPYIQLAKVLVVKAQVAAEQQRKGSGRHEPAP